MSRTESARRSAKFSDKLQGLEPKAQGPGADAAGWTTTLEFVTPMFGGGVELSPTGHAHIKQVDPVTLVRGASLRGQLRFWWRHTCGAGLPDDELREREGLLWGWASTPDKPRKGLVSLSIDPSGLKATRPEAVYDTTDPRKPKAGYGDPLAYGAFPLQPAQGATSRQPGTLTVVPGQFEVRLLLTLAHGDGAALNAAWPNSRRRDPNGVPRPLIDVLKDEVERTWLAFITFGGLGGRTRRGFGAVRAVGGDLAKVSVGDALKRLDWAGRVHLGGSTVATALDAQRRALGKMMAFRQGRDLGRNPGQAGANKPGRSRWPEPDSIRQITRVSDPQHGTPTVAVRGFPRAAFGLPVITHFQSKKDPAQTSLQPEGRERLASPLLLVPLRDGDKWRAGAVQLPLEGRTRQAIRRLQLTGGGLGKQGEIVSGLLSAADARGIQPVRDHLHGAAPADSLDAVYTAFVNYFKT